jgi:hypothetical protein
MEQREPPAVASRQPLAAAPQATPPTLRTAEPKRFQRESGALDSFDGPLSADEEYAEALEDAALDHEMAQVRGGHTCRFRVNAKARGWWNANG